MHVCACVCVYVHLHVCVNVHLHVCLNLSVCVCMCMWLHKINSRLGTKPFAVPSEVFTTSEKKISESIGTSSPGIKILTVNWATW